MSVRAVDTLDVVLATDRMLAPSRSVRHRTRTRFAQAMSIGASRDSLSEATVFAAHRA
jgi:hypothetical protein